jgi:hypothetical protein
MEDKLWEPLDPELWELTHNPRLVLLTASLSKIRSLMANPYRQTGSHTAFPVQV